LHYTDEQGNSYSVYSDHEETKFLNSYFVSISDKDDRGIILPAFLGKCNNSL